MRKEYQNYVFDLYGTLVDIHTEEGPPILWKKLATYLAFQGYALDARGLRADYLHFCALLSAKAEETFPARHLQGPFEIEIRDVWRMLLARRGTAPDDRLIEDVCRLFRALSLKKLRLYPDALPTLAALRKEGRGVYLLSNAQSAFTRPELRFLGLEDRFDGILISSEAGCKKPSPSFFSLLQSRFGLEPENTVMIGNDAESDCQGAAGVGMDSLYIFTGGPARPENGLPGNCREIKRLRDVLSDPEH